MRISDPVRFANRLVIPVGLALFAVAVIVTATAPFTWRGQPVTFIFTLPLAFASSWLALVAHNLKKEKTNEHR